MTRGERTGAAGGCGGGGLTVVVCADSSRFIDERVLAGVRKFLAGATSLHVLLNTHAAVAGVRRRCKGKGQGAPGGGGARGVGGGGRGGGNGARGAPQGAGEGAAGELTEFERSEFRSPGYFPAAGDALADPWICAGSRSGC